MCGSGYLYEILQPICSDVRLVPWPAGSLTYACSVTNLRYYYDRVYSSACLLAFEPRINGTSLIYLPTVVLLTGYNTAGPPSLLSGVRRYWTDVAIA